MFKNLWAIIVLIGCGIASFCITRFDNFGPGVTAPFSRELERSDKHKIVLYTIKNAVFFGVVTYGVNRLLNFSKLTNLGINLFFIGIGIVTFVFIEATTKEKNPTLVGKNLMNSINTIFFFN